MADNKVLEKVGGLIKQMRVKFTGIGRELDRSTGQAPPLGTQSFNGGSKPQRWFGRQFSTQMSSSNDLDAGDEYGAAVAAAALAITSLEPNISDQRKPTAVPETPLEKIKSKKGDTATALKDQGSMSQRFTAKTSSKPDRSDSTRADIAGMMPDKPTHPVPSIKRAPTFPDKQLEESESMKTESRKPKPGLPSPILPPPPPIQPLFPEKVTQTPGIQETEADAWERAELTKIKQRYDKLNTSIVEWEDSKKKKAKQKLEKIESDLQQRRAKATQHVQIEMGRINQIVQGAHAQAKERQRNEELKAKEKANRFRATGEFPTCLCF